MTITFDEDYNKKFHDSTFVTNVKAAPSLKKLSDRVVLNAILDGGGRVDEPRCYPGAGDEVIGHVENWFNGRDDSTAPMFWLSGSAGAGKSAIVQTIAKRCDERGVPHANFFFSRADSSRSKLYPLIATLGYQIISLYPALRNLIATVIHYNPPILDVSLKDQLMQLIFAPLRTLQQSSPAYHPLLLLIDRLDECDSAEKPSQQQILEAFDSIFAAHSPPFPFRILVASLTEPQIETAFNKLSSPYVRLYLDDTYSPSSDIRKFVQDEFQRVRKTHPLRHTLDATWPPVEDVDYIVEKSSGKPIFAATVGRFVSESSEAPTISLDRIKGITQIVKRSPFSHLDAVYTYILKQVDDQDALKDILTAQLLLDQISSSLSTGQLLKVYNRKYTAPIVDSCLAALTPVAEYVDKKLKFHHASFPDFLSDKSRTSDYFVDTVPFAYEVLPFVCNHLEDSLHFGNFVKCVIRRLEQLPPGLLGTFASSKSFIDSINISDAELFRKIEKLCVRSEDDTRNLRRLCRTWIRSQIDRLKLWENRKVINNIPFGSRYYQMALAERFMGAPDNITDSSEGNDVINISLSTASNFDRREAALWLRELLRDMHRKKYTGNAEGYRKLVKAWISWAVQNDITMKTMNGPVNGPNDASTNDVPYSRRYFTMARIKHNHATLPSGSDVAFLIPESDFDRQELALWLEDLLRDIHGKAYSTNRKRYSKLVKAWISWAYWKNIPLDRFRSLPDVQWYIRINAMQLWALMPLIILFLIAEMIGKHVYLSTFFLICLVWFRLRDTSQVTVKMPNPTCAAFSEGISLGPGVCVAPHRG